MVMDEVSLRNFVRLDEKPKHLCSGFSHEKLPLTWEIVCYAIMRFTLEDKSKALYYYHFSILNHFRNREIILFPFLLLHYIEDYV